MNGSGGRTDVLRRGRVLISLAEDRRAVGGFYEAILAMMIVTAGIVLLTCSFTFLAVDRGHDDGLEKECEDIVGSVLANRTVTPSERMLDQRQLDRVEWSSFRGDPEVKMAIFLTLPDGSSRTLYRDAGNSAGERCSVSEPVNMIEHGGKVSAALLTVWVWR